MKWMPIETAPRDGTPMLVYGGDLNTVYCGDDNADRPVMMAVAWFETRKIDPDGRWRFACYDSGFYGVWPVPTHWMPLPEPPND